MVQSLILSVAELFENNTYILWIIILLGLVIGILGALYKNYKIKNQNTEKEDTDFFGFLFDEKNNIFYSAMDAWQRKYGYCRLYDEASAPLSMIIDCEPVYFEYEGKRWLIEFWKGQYGATTGCEIGVYTTKNPEIDIPGLFNGTFYGDTNEEDLLEMSFTLIKDNRVLFSRKAKHWWLTGFKLGEFSDPDELTANIRIQLKNEEMKNIFVKALKEAGYSESEYMESGSSVFIKFTTPHSKQPYTRTALIEEIAQRNNKMYCDAINAITGGISNGLMKINYIKNNDKKLYRKLKASAENKKLYKGFNKIVKANMR